jgi:hypothetical protein
MACNRKICQSISLWLKKKLKKGYDYGMDTKN